MSLKTLLNKKSRRILGLMSGTSCDGLDMAVVDIHGSGRNTRFEIVATGHKAYTDRQKSVLLQLVSNQKAPLHLVSKVNFWLPRKWAEAIASFLNKNCLSATEIDAIGSHGQTVYHQSQPETVAGRKICSTLQIGDPSVLAQLTGITVVGDFRTADMALGGQGAPLVPYFDWLYYSRFKKNTLALNIGGISNITYIPADGDFSKVTALDCGPGNLLLDQAVQRMYEMPFDRNGNIAARGKLSTRLLNYLIKNDTFIHQLPPRSTGREHYGSTFIIKTLKRAVRLRLMEPDIMHTLSYYTVYAIHDAVNRFIKTEGPIELLSVGGGGAHNKFLMKMLAEVFSPAEVQTAGRTGIDEDYKEAICFAVLAHETLNGMPSNVPQVTGATRPAILGKICQGG